MMRYLSYLCVALNLLLAGCNDDDPGPSEKEEPQKIACSDPDTKAATICCYDPTDDENADCSMSCQPTCASDEDCSEGEFCQDGICGPDGDCSL